MEPAAFYTGKSLDWELIWGDWRGGGDSRFLYLSIAFFSLPTASFLQFLMEGV